MINFPFANTMHILYFDYRDYFVPRDTIGIITYFQPKPKIQKNKIILSHE